MVLTNSVIDRGCSPDSTLQIYKIIAVDVPVDRYYNNLLILRDFLSLAGLLYLQLLELHVRRLNTEGVRAGIDLGAGGR